MITDGGKYSIGIIGAGWVAGARHVPAYLKDGRCAVEAVYDRDITRARQLASRYNIPTATDNIDELLDRAKDAVSICTPPFSHAELAIRALRQGRHVLVEKPMAMNSVEGEAMVAAARETGRQLCVCHNFLFSRSLRRAQRLLADGTVGEVRHAMGLQLSSPQRRLPTWYPSLPGGLFFDEAPHMIYILRHFLGDLAVRGAWSLAAAPGERQSIERLECSLASADRSAQLTMSFQAPLSEWLVLVVGTRCCLLIDVFRDMLTVLGSDEGHGSAGVLKSSLSFFAQAAAGFTTSGALHATGRLYYGHEELVRRFLDSLEGGAPPVALEESLAVLRTVEEISRAATLPAVASAA